MNFEFESYEEFLRQLRALVFLPAVKVLARREDLVSFLSKDTNELSRREYPDFGEQIKRWGNWDDLKKSARPKFDYYCGFAGDAHFTKKSRTDRGLWLFPIRGHHDYLPCEGDIIMGQTEIGTESPRFIWWDVASLEEMRFRQILLGELTYSTMERYEKRLAVETRGRKDKRLFFAVVALRFRDADFFADMIKRGERIQGNRDCEVDQWLARIVSKMLPDFWEEFKRKAGLSCLH